MYTCTYALVEGTRASMPIMIKYNCIYRYLNLDVRDVPIQYLDIIMFYKCIKSNYNLFLSNNDDLDLIKEKYAYYSKIIQGLYKWKEKTIYIKETERNNQCLLLTELLHSKSITQGHSEIESWFCEGLPHYLSYLLCKECSIEYKPSAFIISRPYANIVSLSCGSNSISIISSDGIERIITTESTTGLKSSSILSNNRGKYSPLSK